MSGLASGVTAISAGAFHSCALTSGGGVKCWGYNGDGELGDGTTTDNSTPVNVSGLTSGVSGISAGNVHTCALTSGGGVKCWGYNSSGQLGDGTTTASLTPIDVSGLTSGADRSWVTRCCAVRTVAGSSAGATPDRLGRQTGRLRSPTRRRSTANGLRATGPRYSAGSSHTCALTTAAASSCWGTNGYGQLGHGTTQQLYAQWT